MASNRGVLCCIGAGVLAGQAVSWLMLGVAYGWIAFLIFFVLALVCVRDGADTPEHRHD